MLCLIVWAMEQMARATTGVIDYGSGVRRDDVPLNQINIKESEMTESVQTLTPHLVVNDARAALEFYKRGLGATEVTRMPAQDGKRLMHSEINFNGARIFVMDDFPEMREYHGGLNWTTPNTLGGTSVTVHVEVANCDQAVKRMADAGATIMQPPWDAFWGARYGQVRDPFGHSWSFAHALPVKN